MHPHILQLLASERARELRRRAQISELLASERAPEPRTQAQRARLRVTRPAPRNSLRHRAGWTLVEIGLRLAGTSQHA